ncbi:MAG: hypothetical protein ACK5JT_10875 [Hyphomicrobiaceae bacterium]
MTAQVMTKAEAERLLRHVHLELARDHDHPAGSSGHRYELVVPLDQDGQIVSAAWRAIRDRCRVKRISEGGASEIGHVVHKRGGAWAFHYDIHGDAESDEAGYRLDHHKFLPGEYVSITEHDGNLRTFLVKAVVDLD